MRGDADWVPKWISGDLHASDGVEKVVDVHCTRMPTEMPTAQQIGSAIQNLREALQLSVRTFARLCTLSPHRLRQIESGEVEATDQEHRRILSVWDGYFNPNRASDRRVRPTDGDDGMNVGARGFASYREAAEASRFLVGAVCLVVWAS
jgi:transcriptional regulator with XRE-family HTH domain